MVSEVPKQRKTVRVVIADDSASIRNSLAALIRRLRDVEIVGIAHNGAEALEIIRAQQPDVVTLDIRMPGMTGLEVLEVMQREQLGPTVIMLTGLGEAEYEQKCRELGAHYFFEKATEFEKVLELLDERARGLVN